MNLRAAHKNTPPRAFHLEAAEVPEARRSGARVRVLAGTFDGVSSPLTELATPVLLLDVFVDAGARLEIPAPHPLFVLAIDGDGAVGAEPLPAHGALTTEAPVVLTGGVGGLHAVVGGGAPIGAPVVFGGPFVGNTRADIEAAHARYQRGEMGRLDPSF